MYGKEKGVWLKLIKLTIGGERFQTKGRLCWVKWGGRMCLFIKHKHRISFFFLDYKQINGMFRFQFQGNSHQSLAIYQLVFSHLAINAFSTHI